MKKLQSTLPNMLIVLTCIAVIAGGALAAVNKVTAEPIRANLSKALTEGINRVLQAENAALLQTDTVKDCVIYTTDKGVAVESVDANGFGGALKVLVGFADDGSIKGYTVLQHAETPGLGAKAEQWFQKGGKGNIIGMNPGEKALTVSKDGGNVDAITASTITSRAFLRAVNAAYQSYKGDGTDVHTGASQQADVEAASSAQADGETGASVQGEGHHHKGEGHHRKEHHRKGEGRHCKNVGRHCNNDNDKD